MQRGWESEIGGSRPEIEMVGGDYSSRPRPYMGCSVWVDGWMAGFFTFNKIISENHAVKELMWRDIKCIVASFHCNNGHANALRRYFIRTVQFRDLGTFKVRKWGKTEEKGSAGYEAGTLL
jgi:hypothetical protein